MDKIKFMSKNGTKFFEIPWTWIEKGGLKPKSNELQSKAKRGTLNGRLYKKRQAIIPDYTLQFVNKLYRFQVKELFEIIKQEEMNVYYFDHYVGEFVTKDFYVPWPDLAVDKVPPNNEVDNILYQPFLLEFISMGDVS